MARIECPHEADVLTMVYTGRWPERAPGDLRAHVETCALCADVATSAAAIENEAADRFTAPLPPSGAVWWRAQMRARQEALREAARPITVAQLVGVAAAMAIVGALFGATSGWFQRALGSFGRSVADMAGAVPVPSVDTASSPLATLAGYSTILIVVVVGIAVMMAVVAWAFGEE
jgi:hypothetical protein